MKDKVFMSPNNAELVVGIPLFRRHAMDDNSIGHSIILLIQDDKPLAYCIDCGPEVEIVQCLNSDFVENKLECLGDL